MVQIYGKIAGLNLTEKASFRPEDSKNATVFRLKSAAISRSSGKHFYKTGGHFPV